MIKLLTAILFALCIEMQDGMEIPANDLYQITRASEITKTGTTEKKFVFKDTMTYTFDGTLSGNSFTLTLKKHDLPEATNSVFRYGPIIAFGGLSDNEHYNPRQVAFYMNTEKTAFLAERCDADANAGDGACILTGSVSYNSQRWMIQSVNETHYGIMRSDEESSRDSFIINEANNWARGVTEPNTRLDQKSYSVVKRDIHERHKRSVTTTCNIFEVVAVADATVWEYFLERNSGNETAAETDLRLHYNALLREVDLVYASVSDRLCLQSYLRDVVIQKNESTDWTHLTPTGNVDLVSSISRCAQFNTAGADAPFCFTRRKIQFGATVSGIRASGTFTSVCSNETFESAVFEDNHDGLSRIAALVIAVQIDGNVLSCTSNPSVNNTFRADDSQSNEPPDTSDYSLTYTLSNCSVDILTARIEQLNNESNNCLLQGNLTDEILSLIAAFRSSAGRKVPLNHQCQLAFGVDSYACDLYNSTAGLVIPNTALCGAGAFCTNNGTCGINQTIVYSGIPCGTNKICYKGVCRPNFDCGGLPIPPNGFFTSSGNSSFRSRAHLNCFPGFNITTNVTIYCLRDGWQAPSENCTTPMVITTTAATTQPTSSGFGVFPG